MLICVPIKKKTFKDCLQSFKKAQKIGDVVEIWFDSFSAGGEIKDLFKIKSKPILYKVEGTDKDFQKVLQTNSIDYIDLDLSTPQNVIKKIKYDQPKVKIIISFHDFKKTPSLKMLEKISDEMIKIGADIVKIATFANNFKDSMTILELLSGLTARNIKAICLAMGKEGEFTRTAGQFLGNYLMYAPLSEGEKTASGQITAQKFKKILKSIN